MTITQDGERVNDYYYDYDKKQSLHGLPDDTAANKKKYDSDDWQMFFTKIKKFLKPEIEKVVLPTYVAPATNSKPVTTNDIEDVFADDSTIPF